MRLARLPSRARLVLLLAAVLVVPAILGAAIGRTVLAAPAPPSAVGRLPVIGTATLGVLDRSQTAADRRAAPTGAGVVHDTVRRVSVVPSVGAVVQLAQNSAGQVCLVASLRAGKRFTASCASRAEAERDGLTLQFSITALAAVRLFSERGVLPRFVTLTWTPDGRLHLDERTDASA
jgi:hypothetical protein